MREERKGAAPPEKPVGIQWVCDYLGRKQTFVYEQCNKGVIPYHQMGGVKFFFPTEIEAALKRL